MGIAFYTGISGMEGYQKKLDVVAHNIANVNTYGYKTRRASFSDLLYTKMNVHSNYGLTVTEKEQQDALGNQVTPTEPGVTDMAYDMVGHGSRVSSVDLLYGQAGLDATGYPLDFAILGEGFFAVDNGGSVEYTRNGAFELQIQGKTAYLVTQDGSYVLDNKGKQIKLKVDENGMPDMEGLSDKLGVYFFSNPYGLTPADSSRYLASTNSGTPTAARGRANEPEYEIKQYALEVSSVDLSDEMVEMIQAQRAFQLNSRVVQTADQIDEIINNLR